MKKKEWNEGLNYLDPDLVEKYVLQKERLREKNKKPKSAWLRFGAIAACFVLIVGADIVVPLLRGDEPGSEVGGVPHTPDKPGNAPPAEYFQVQKNDNGEIVFSVVAGFPQAKYTFKDADAEESVGIALNNESGEVNGLLFDLLHGKSTISDEEIGELTDCISMTFSYMSYAPDHAYHEMTVIYEFKWSSTSNAMTIFKNNILVGTVLLSNDEMSTFEGALQNLR